MRFRLNEAHENFKKYLQSLTIKPEVKMDYMEMMQQVFIEKEGIKEREIQHLQSKIQRTTDLIHSAEDKFFKDQIDEVTF